jgi:hypothetical protein
MADLEGDASRITEGLFRGESATDRSDVYLDDIMVEVKEFLFDLRMVGDQFPCVRREDDSLVPLALNVSGPFNFQDLRFRLRGWRFFQNLRFHLGGWRSRERISFVDTNFAQELFRDGLRSFLISRLQSLNETSSRRIILEIPKFNFLGTHVGTASVAGFQVDVSASANLRVHVSPTFRRNWRYFGSPTSPVYGVLIGGIYEFGVDGGPYAPITPDHAKFDIPYATVSPVLSL